MTRSGVSLLSASVVVMVGLSPAQALGQQATFRSGPRDVLGLEEHLTASVSFADVDGDGDLDALVANGRHWVQPNEVYLNNGRGQFAVSWPLDHRRARSYGVPAGDLDGDGDVDVIVANDVAENWVYMNDGAGRFEYAWDVGPEVEPTRSATLSDLNGDGHLDVLVTNRGAPNGFYLNDGSGRFGARTEFGETRGSTIAVAVADIDDDGHPDLVLANRDGQANQILFNDGRLGFSKISVFGTGTDETRSVAVADLNGDGTLDIVTANIMEPNRVYLGNGNGTFRESAVLGGDTHSSSLVLLDADGNGHLDVLFGNAGPNELYLNDGDAVDWTAVAIEDNGDTTYGVAAADLNGDGLADFGVANSGSVNRVYLNAGGRPSPP